MPGKLSLGLEAISVGAYAWKNQVARAHCEGRAASAAGALRTANPDPDNKSEGFIAWDQGWEDEDTGAVSVKDTGCAI